MNTALETTQSPEGKGFEMDLRNEKREKQNRYPSSRGEEPEAYLEFKEGVTEAVIANAEEFENRNPGEEMPIGRVDGLPTTGEQADNYSAKDYAKWFEELNEDLKHSKELLELGIIALPENFRIKSGRLSEIEKFTNRELLELTDILKILSYSDKDVKLPSFTNVYTIRDEMEDHYDIGEVSRAIFRNDKSRSPRSHKSVELFMKKLDLTKKQEEFFNKALHAGGIRRLIHGATSKISRS